MGLASLVERAGEQMRPSLALALTLVLAAVAAFSPPLQAESNKAWNVPPEEARRANPVVSDRNTVGLGEKLYQDRCSDCHGSKGRGDGPGGSDLDRRPTDFTQSPTQSQTDGSLYWKITEGRKPMPGYARKLTDEQRWQLVNYLRTLKRK